MLTQIFHWIEPRRTTQTAFWREKIRQQLNIHFTHRRPGELALDAFTA